MKAILRRGLIAFFLCTPLLQGSQIQTGDIRIDNQILEYPASAEFLKAVHFRDLAYRIDGDWIQLHNGEYIKTLQFGGTDTKIERVWFFDRKGSVPQHALVWITQAICGASCGVGGKALVFEIRDGKLVEVQHFEFPAKLPEAGVQLDPAHGRLVVTAGSQNAVYLHELTCTWEEDRFEPTAYRLRLAY